MRLTRFVTTYGVALACALAVAAAGCTSDGSGDETDTPAQPDTSTSATGAPEGEPMELEVLVYNIEYGGNASTDAVMRSIDADVVGVLESYNRLPEIAEKTGYPYYNVGLQLLSKYPIHEPSGADGLYALIEVQPGYAVAFFNTHLDYVKYGPHLLAQGVPVADVIDSENEVRTSSIRILMPKMAQVTDAGYPTFLTGDFNEPSNLDYTEETVGSRPGVDEVIPWPVSEAVLNAGFVDTFREVHPDPVENPGLTHDNPDFRAGGAGDRIDYVYAGGPLETVDSELVGKQGDPNVEIGFDRWTSDHRAVVSRFELTPVALPTTVSLDRRMLTEGDTLGVSYNAPGASELSVEVDPADGPAEPLIELSLDGTSGSTTLDTADLDPGGYEIVMRDADGDEVARNEFWMRSEDAAVQLSTDKRTYAKGEPITVTWDDGPANRWDWVSVFHADDADPETGDYLVWGYTGGHDSGALPPSVSGSMVFDGSSQGRPWPLPRGDYVVHYLLTDQYTSAGQTRFTVR